MSPHRSVFLWFRICVFPLKRGRVVSHLPLPRGKERLIRGVPLNPFTERCYHFSVFIQETSNETINTFTSR